MSCTAKPELTLAEQLAKAEDCVKFDEVYYKHLGQTSPESDAFACGCVVCCWLLGWFLVVALGGGSF